MTSQKILIYTGFKLTLILVIGGYLVKYIAL